MTNRLWVDLRINGFNPDSVPESEKHHGIVMVSEADAMAQVDLGVSVEEALSRLRAVSLDLGRPSTTTIDTRVVRVVLDEIDRLRRAADDAEIATWPAWMQENFRGVSAQRETMKAMIVRQSPYALPAPEDRPDGFRCLTFHRGKWRDVCWSVDRQRFSLGYGGAFIIKGDRQFAQLPPIPADDAWGFYGDRS